MSNRMRMTGINSGMDTQSIIEQLVDVKKTKKEKLKKQQTKLGWKQDSWKTLNSKIYGLYNEQFGKMRLQGSFSAKKATIADSSIATVTADNGAVTGSQSLKVKQLAATAYVTGAKLEDLHKDPDKTMADMTLADLIEKRVDDNVDAKYKEIEASGQHWSEAQRLNYYDEQSALWGKESQFFQVKKDNSDDSSWEEVEIRKDMTMKQIADAFAATGINASFDASNGRFYFSSKTEGAEGQFQIKSKDMKDVMGVSDDESTKVDMNSGNWMELLGLNKNVSGSSFIEGQDAEIELNGALYTKNTNSFSINGLNISVNKVSESATNISVTNDTDSVYNMIKDFFKKYNEIITEMDKLYNADSAKDYEPLTSEEKDAMSDDEVEEWETKIKDSLLRRDDNLSKLISTLKEGMSKAVTVSSGKTYSLASFGINTLSYFEAADNERGVYHIDGDQDDEKTKGATDVLKEMLANNLDDTVEFFSKLTSGVYDNLTKQMARVPEYRSFQSLYDDKQLQKEYDNLSTKIKKEEDYLSDYEDKWYDKFAAMEKAMAKVNSKSDALGGLLGG